MELLSMYYTDIAIFSVILIFVALFMRKVHRHALSASFKDANRQLQEQKFDNYFKEF
jgi:hypothetical protein